MAQIVLQLNDYERVDVPSTVLEQYFLAGDEQSLLATIRSMRVKAQSPTTDS